MNVFEIAVLRVLIKRQQPMKLSILVSGFPDDSEDNVLSAISSLKLQGYLMFDDYQPNGIISINRERRKEILQIVDSNIQEDKFQSLTDEKKKEAGTPISVKKSPLQAAARHLMSPSVRTFAVSSLLIVGLVSAIGISLPTATSPDSQFVAYPGYMAHKKWSIAHADGDHEGYKIPSTPPYPPPPIPASFLALKDCNQKPLQGQQQT